MSANTRIRPVGFAISAFACVALVNCATPDTRTTQERAADHAIALQVRAALAAAPDLDSDHVEVRVRRSVLRLSGIVGDVDDLRGVLQVAWAVPGVHSVDDQIEIDDFNYSNNGSSSSGTGGL